MPNNIGDPYYQPIPPQGMYYGNNQSYNRVSQAGNPYPQGPQFQVSQSNAPRIIDTVQGDLAASIYPINYYPQEIFLVDMDQGFVYKRNRDNTGKLSPLEKFKMVPATDESEKTFDESKFVKEDEILDLISEVVQDQLEKRLADIFSKKGGKES